MTKDDLNCLVVPAMLYALKKDKEGFVTDTVTRALVRNASDIRADIRYQMGETIANALNADEGDLMNHMMWDRVLKAFSEVL
jgi:hypothetical protein